jgi:lipoate-protein ligase A
MKFVTGNSKLLQDVTWRLLLHPPDRGTWNMAVDEAILEEVGLGSSPPTLRLYAWTPPCLSLGFSQTSANVDKAALNQNGWDLVRRPTGGKAILHTDELTYAVTAPLQEPNVGGGLLKSYHSIAQPLMEALRLLGLHPESEKNDNLTPATRPQEPVCFEVPSHYEITIQGKKLIGSAQARRKEALLQHGSVPLGGDLTRITRAFHYPDDSFRQKAARRLLEHAATLETFLGYALTWEDASKSLISAFQSTFKIQLSPGQLTLAEEEKAIKLEKEKFANPAWTDRC